MASSVEPRFRLGLGVEEGIGLGLDGFSWRASAFGCWNFSACTASSPMAAQMGAYFPRCKVSCSGKKWAVVTAESRRSVGLNRTLFSGASRGSSRE